MAAAPSAAMGSAAENFQQVDFFFIKQHLMKRRNQEHQVAPSCF
jgi:hypothetical protein